ncbi:MAG: hypothetical protein J0G30_11350 [Actinomycetales bacterium]|nr:hypothetical protein [Actinomycetales bacterium]
MSDYGTPSPGQETGHERPPEQLIDEDRQDEEREQEREGTPTPDDNPLADEPPAVRGPASVVEGDATASPDSSPATRGQYPGDGGEESDPEGDDESEARGEATR